MEYTIEKKGKGAKGHTRVFVDGEDMATCFGHLYRSTTGLLKTKRAIDDAKDIVAGLNLRAELIKLPSKVTKKQLLEIINKYKKL